MTITDSGFGPEPDKLSQQSRAPSISPVAKADSHSTWHCWISSDQSQDSDDNQPLEGPKHSSPLEVHQWSGSPGYEPSSVTGHKPIVMTISNSGAKFYNLKDTHSQILNTWEQTEIFLFWVRSWDLSHGQHEREEKAQEEEVFQQISCSKDYFVLHASATRLNGQELQLDVGCY